MKCRDKCGACCIAPSIELSMPNMPDGKKAGAMCKNLNPADYSCNIWGSDDYPEHCRKFIPVEDVCGVSRDNALQLIDAMELATKPA